ncbi:hypothetical protein CANARDRAFT_188386, partial [[Candida] arabinofermentans NRRL YB-2248]
MICDLNVPWPVSDYTPITTKQLNSLKLTLATLEELGYTHIAINFKINQSLKIPNLINEINPINLNDFKEFNQRLKIFTRITIIISDPSQCQNISKFQQVFDILSIEPITEKALLLSISNFEIDLISLDLSLKLPCYLKPKTICSGIEKGLFFEIKYGDLLNTNTSNRSLTISNIKQLIRASRSRGLICSSGCSSISTMTHLLRSFNDVVNLLILIGLDNNRSSQTMKDWSLKVLINGRLRIKSYKQVIVISGDGNLIDNSLEKK